MSLSSGTRLGPYEILTLVGAGGMGEVYRARDTTLGRNIALKILPAEFALDPDRLARFRREAQVLASLNHPNIAQIYGLEDSDHVHALVMELVDGPTLADRITRGPIPIDEALRITRQIAEALEGAHGQGIIHRDLKAGEYQGARRRHGESAGLRIGQGAGAGFRRTRGRDDLADDHDAGDDADGDATRDRCLHVAGAGERTSSR